MSERKWTLWSERRPPNEDGLFRYRVRANILGLIMRPEWTEKMHLCGMGFDDAEYWPLSPCRWNGSRRYITHAGLEWSPIEHDDSGDVFWGEINLLPCPFTGTQPKIKAVGKWIGAPLWESEALYISSQMIPASRWTDAKKMVAAWNTRAPIENEGSN